MLLAGGSESLTYDANDLKNSNEKILLDFVGILPNGQKCSPSQDKTTIPSTDHCRNCVGVAYASKKGRWIFRCGGKRPSENCKKIKDRKYK